MSLNISKLENVRSRGDKTIARCPACAEAGRDQNGEHLFINTDGRFGCVVFAGDSEHRKRIFALCGDRGIKPLAVRPPGLGRLGRVFETHLEPGRQPGREKERTVDGQLNDCRKGVLSVLNHSSMSPDRPLTEYEQALLMRACGVDEIILEARRLFNATIVGIERSR